MKLSNKQAMMLLDIAQESLTMLCRFGGYDLIIRQQLVNDLINQQSNTLIEIDTPTVENDKCRKK